MHPSCIFTRKHKQKKDATYPLLKKEIYNNCLDYPAPPRLFEKLNKSLPPLHSKKNQNEYYPKPAQKKIKKFNLKI